MRQEIGAAIVIMVIALGFGAVWFIYGLAIRSALKNRQARRRDSRSVQSHPRRLPESHDK